jgi:hypothetical protein
MYAERDGLLLAVINPDWLRSPIDKYASASRGERTSGSRFSHGGLSS